MPWKTPPRNSVPIIPPGRAVPRPRWCWCCGTPGVIAGRQNRRGTCMRQQYIWHRLTTSFISFNVLKHLIYDMIGPSNLSAWECGVKAGVLRQNDQWLNDNQKYSTCLYIHVFHSFWSNHLIAAHAPCTCCGCWFLQVYQWNSKKTEESGFLLETSKWNFSCFASGFITWSLRRPAAVIPEPNAIVLDLMAMQPWADQLLGSRQRSQLELESCSEGMQLWPNCHAHPN